jgi:flavin reductase (DIM6/NTAB) family NADH-FMN oxidoreductase RutF
MSDLQATFAALADDLDPPMVIVTTVADGEMSGCLVGFTTQCSIDPTRVLVCLSDKNHTTRLAADAGALAVHLVDEDAKELARLFGSETGDEVDKFAHCSWHSGPEGLPILDACPRWFAGRILERFRTGDHIAHLIELLAAERGGAGPVFSFGQTHDLEPGHEA